MAAALFSVAAFFYGKIIFFLEGEASGYIALCRGCGILCSWMLYNVARHQDVQAKIKDELAAAGLLHVPDKPAPVPVDWSHLGALPYLNVVIKESLRSHTTAATGTGR
jgi:hypothetical protein